MKNRWRSGWLVVAVVLAPVLASCRGGDGVARAAAEDTSAAGAPVRVVNVEALAVGFEPFTDEVTLTGSVTAGRDVIVASEESGVIRELLVDKGQHVAAGDAIAKIDDRLLRAQYDQIQAEAQLASETWERQRRLWEEDSIGSELAYLRAKYGAETAAANARVAATRLERTTVRAPISGMLDDRFVETGATVAPGSPVARIIDADPLRVTVGVPERYAGQVRVGSRAEVSLESGVRAEARASFVGTAVNEDNRTFAVEIRVPNRQGAIKPGMLANVRLALGTEREAILVPRDAVLRGERGFVVYVVVERDGRSVADVRSVTTADGGAGRVVVEGGLSPGDNVIVVGQQQVAAGDFVRVTNVAGGGAS